MGHPELSGPLFQRFLLLEIFLLVCTFSGCLIFESSVSKTCFPLKSFYPFSNTHPPPPGALILESGVFSYFRVLNVQKVISTSSSLCPFHVLALWTLWVCMDHYYNEGPISRRSSEHP